MDSGEEESLESLARGVRDAAKIMRSENWADAVPRTHTLVLTAHTLDLKFVLYLLEHLNGMSFEARLTKRRKGREVPLEFSNRLADLADDLAGLLEKGTVGKALVDSLQSDLVETRWKLTSWQAGKGGDD